jgi:hypothetical protein
LAALNDVPILATDIGNAYLNANPREKVYTTAGPEFGNELQGKSVLIERALYGLKSSGAAWRAHLANTLHQLGYTSCLADPDVWFRPARKTDNFSIMNMFWCMLMTFWSSHTKEKKKNENLRRVLPIIGRFHTSHVILGS